MLASELAHFVVHDELHQLQACLAHQLADALLQGGGDFFERQVQLQFLPGFFGLLVELANGLFAVNLVSFLHSDSPFSKMKNITPSLTARTGESLLSTNYRTSSFANGQARGFAKRLLSENKDDAERIERAYLMALAHKPGPEEIDIAESYLRNYARRQTSSTDARGAAWKSFCKMLLASNEFHYID